MWCWVFNESLETQSYKLDAHTIVRNSRKSFDEIYNASQVYGWNGMESVCNNGICYLLIEGMGMSCNVL